MSKKKLAMLTLSLVLIATVGVGATLAYFTDSDAATNTITMGHVDIDFDEPNYDKPVDDPTTPDVDESKEEKDNVITDIIPGEVITKDPTITVAQDSADAYLRASIEIGGVDDAQAAELLDGIVINTGWVLAEDGYYYYQSKVTAGDSAVLFNEVTIPATWGNEVADKTLTIDVKAEAIQADNFEPEMADGVIVGWKDAEGNAITPKTYTQE